MIRHPETAPLWPNPHRPRRRGLWDGLDRRPPPPTFTPTRATPEQCDRLAALLWGNEETWDQGLELLAAIYGAPLPRWWTAAAFPLPVTEGRWKKGAWRRIARLLLDLLACSPAGQPLTSPLLAGVAVPTAAREAHAVLITAGARGLLPATRERPPCPVEWVHVHMLRPEQAEALSPHLPAHLHPVLARVTAGQGLPPWTAGEVLAVLLGALEESMATKGAP